MVLNYNYISTEGEANLKAYKYSGTDKSLLYKYFFSKIANFFVNHIIPEWLAYII